jgi:protein SCO1/2
LKYQGASVIVPAPSRGSDAQPMSPARQRIRDRNFPNVSLRTHQNRPVRFYDDLVKDKIVVINFMYAECEGICPGITMNLAKVQKLLGKRVGRDVFMYSITLQPANDTPGVLAAYAREHGVKPGWTFLTGDPVDVEHLRQSLGFVDSDPELDKDKENHIGNIRYGNEPLMLWAACPGMSDAKWIVESLSWVARAE